MVFRELLLYCKAQAIKDALLPSEESVWFSLCMSYSQKFHVPLPEVLKMDPEHVMRAEFTNQIENINISKNIGTILEQLNVLENPDHEKNKKAELEDFIKMAEQEEEERVKAGKPIKGMEKALHKVVELEAEKQPTGGSVNFDGLEDEEPGYF